MSPITQPTGEPDTVQTTGTTSTNSELLDRIVEASYPALASTSQDREDEFEREELSRLDEARTRARDQLKLNQVALQPLLSAIAGRKLTVSQSTITALDQKISRIRGLLSKQVTPILHHPKFQRLEASWRGLEYLISQTKPRPMMRLKVFNAREQELVDDFSQKAWTSSVLYRKVYENGLDLAGGIPFSALLGDYEFTRSNLGLLRNFSKVASVAHAPFLASVGPAMFDLKTFEGFNDQIHNIGKTLGSRFNPASFPDWETFRASPDARFCVLTMPRVLMRLPYGVGGQSISGLEFNEAVTGKKHSDYLWGSAAYGLASRLIAAFDSTGWYSRITGMKGGGLVENLPIHRHSGGVTYGVETRWPDPREAELANLGFAALVGVEGSSEPVYYNAPTVFDPTTVATSKDANLKASHELAAGLPYILVASRFAHYLKVILRQKIGSQTDADQLQSELQGWITQYTNANRVAGPELMARKPLREARIEVMPNPSRPGVYHASVYLVPHFQLKEIHVQLSLVAEIPNKK